MKKATPHKTTFPNPPAGNNLVQPRVPVSNSQPDVTGPHADPSSTFRSSRYPVPQFELRMHTAS